MYKEYYIDPLLKRPWTLLEEAFIKRISKRGSISEDMVWSERLQIFWPRFLVMIATRDLLKVGYIAKKPMLGYDFVRYLFTSKGAAALQTKVEYDSALT